MDDNAESLNNTTGVGRALQTGSTEEEGILLESRPPPNRLKGGKGKEKGNVDF